MPRRTGIAVLAVTLALAAGPALALFGDADAHKRIDEQAKTLKALAEQVGAIQSSVEQLKGLEGRIGSVEAVINGGTLLNLLNQIEALNAEIARLRGELETVGNRIDGADRRARDLYLDVDGRLRVLESPAQPPASATLSPVPVGPLPADPGLTAAPPLPETPPMPAVSTGALPTPATAPSPTGSPKAPATLPTARPGAAGDLAGETAAYDTARGAYKEGRYLDAARLFQQFIAVHPGSPLAAPAQYWIGDSLYNARDYAGAVLAQQRLLDTWPGSAKVPDAMLNMASALRDSGDAAGEKRMLDQLLARHPASEAAEKARKRLAARR